MKKIVSVLAPSFIITYFLAIASALDSIGKAFPQLPPSTIQLLTAIPALLAMFVVLLSGTLAAKFTKKQIILVSMGFLIVGGLLPVLIHTHFAILIVSSILTGIGLGGICPLSSALIAEHFEESKQSTMLGFQSAVIGIGGMCFSYFGGVLSTEVWWHAYFTYLVFIPLFILCLFLPKGTLDKPSKASFLGIMNKQLLFILFLGLVLHLFYFVFQNNIALLLNSSQTAGNLLTAQSAIGIVSGVLGGKILGKWGKQSLSIILIVAGVGTALVYFSQALPVLYLSALMLGFIFALRMPAGYTRATAVTKAGYATLAITIFCCITQVGQFLSPIVVNEISSVFHVGRIEQFLISGIILIVVGGISFAKEMHKGDIT